MENKTCVPTSRGFDASASGASVSAHTPGPWSTHRALHPTDGEYDWSISAQIDGRPYCIAEAFGRVAEDIRPDAEANARLLCAAPDLLAALKLCGAEYSTPPGTVTECMHDVYREFNRRMNIAAAAIAKATGGSQCQS